PQLGRLMLYQLSYSRILTRIIHKISTAASIFLLQHLVWLLRAAASLRRFARLRLTIYLPKAYFQYAIRKKSLQVRGVGQAQVSASLRLAYKLFVSLRLFINNPG
ncbi:MAG: hypothetical protein U9N45_02025, partial [Gemmatimonadota bacterium]|nr:hypothetical protein [Gemmatimonadota bacterium]